MHMTREWNNALRTESIHREVIRLVQDLVLLLSELDEIENDSYS